MDNDTLSSKLVDMYNGENGEEQRQGEVRVLVDGRYHLVRWVTTDPNDTDGVLLLVTE